MSGFKRGHSGSRAPRVSVEYSQQLGAMLHTTVVVDTSPETGLYSPARVMAPPPCTSRVRWRADTIGVRMPAHAKEILHERLSAAHGGGGVARAALTAWLVDLQAIGPCLPETYVFRSRKGPNRPISRICRHGAPARNTIDGSGASAAAIAPYNAIHDTTGPGGGNTEPAPSGTGLRPGSLVSTTGSLHSSPQKHGDNSI
jgi:hypothetical protein